MEVGIATVAAKVVAYTVGPIGRYMVCPIVRPIARRCPFKNMWEYKSNLENLKTELKNLEAKRESVQGLTNAGVEPLQDVNDWLDKATNIISEVSGLIGEDNPERRCCEGCTYSNLKECYQHRNNVAHKLKDVAQLLQEAMRSISLWKYKSNLKNLKKEVEKLVARRESVQRLIKDGEEPLPHVKAWQVSVDSIINEILGLVNENNPEHQNNVARKLKDVAQLLQEAKEFREVSTISEKTVYKSSLENLNKEVEMLKLKRMSVQRLIKVGEEPLPDVKVWQVEVKKIIDEVSRLTVECNPEQQNKVARMLKDVAQLLQEAREFRKVWFQPIPEETWLQSSEVYKAFESRTSILKEIIEALSKPDVGLFGIYGLGGIGKTVLAKQVARQVIQDNLFNKIIFIEVSQTPDIKMVQGDIGSKLGLEFREEETISGRAIRLCDRLKKEEKILLILDNIWGSVDFEKIGIPFGNAKGLKLLLTTRNRDLLKDEMNSQHNFHIEVLNEKDAWCLFEKIAGPCVQHPELQYVANDVVKACGGVPLAIVTTAKALKDKKVNEWKNALREFRRPSSESFEGVTAKVHASIQLSYNQLESEELKATFLLCSSMGRTHDASIQDLLRYAIGLGLFTRINNVEEALDNVHTLVRKLKDASLLFNAPNNEDDIPDNERFAMHDVVRDVARSIASRDRHVFTMIDDVIPWSWANEDTLKHYTAITLYDIVEFPKELVLVCPQLKFLYVKLKGSFSRISNNFFIGMPRLQVLHLIEMDLWTLPTSFKCLVNLQTLCLDQCKLGDIAVIGDLKKLEILSFRGCHIKKLPKGMCQLIMLRLLDLSDCSKLRFIPANVISSLTQLEALYIGNPSIQWEIERPNITRRSASINELKNLCHLTTLEIQLPDAQMSKGLLSPKLERYKIFIGDNWKKWEWEIHSKTSRTLKLKVAITEDGIISQLKGIKELELREAPGVRNVLCDLNGNGFPELEHLRVGNNSHCLCIVDSKRSTSCDTLPFLQSLFLSSLINLKRICYNPLGAKSFQQLRTIEVQFCHKLVNIFSFSSNKVLPQLQEIRVSYCQNMEEIFAMEGQDGDNNTEAVNKIQFSQLRILTLKYLPRLKSFCSKGKITCPLQLTSDMKVGEIISEDELETVPLFNDKVMFPNLEILEISEIYFEKIWHSQVSMMSSCVQSLTRLIVGGCDNLKELFLFSIVHNFVQLQYLKIYMCSVLEEMVVMEELREEERRNTVTFAQFSSLKEIKIEKCPKMDIFIFNDKVAYPKLETLEIFEINVEKIWHNQHSTISSCVQNLTRLVVQECPNLEVLFSCSMVNSFAQLKYLEICVCPILEKIIVTEEFREEERRDAKLLPQFSSLKEITIENCSKLEEFIFDDKVGFPNLEKIKILKMNNLKMIWHNEFVDDSFCKLKSLEVSYCEKLLTVLSSDMCRRLLRLEFLHVVSCDSVEQIFDLQDTNFQKRHSTPASQLRELYISNLPKLKYIWNKNPERMLSFGNLKGLEVAECPALKNLIPKSVAMELHELVYLSVSDCGVEEIVAKEEDEVVEEVTARFLFPKLAFLKLDSLPELRTFYPGRHTVKGSALKRLELHHCGKLEIFTPKVLSYYQSDEEGHYLDVPMQQPLFSDDEAFPCLEELKLVGENARMMWEGQIPEFLFQTLKCLKVMHDESAVLPLGIIQRFHNLKKLCLFDGSYEEILSYEEVQKQVGTLAKMKEIDFDGYDNQKYIRIRSGLDLILHNLGVLKVSGCVKLINLMLSSASFQNLTVLRVNDCTSLIDMVTSSAAKNLVQLIEMSIEDCENVVEIVVDQGDVKDDKIIFNKLKILSLSFLPNLTSFCSGNYNLEFPSLEEFTMYNCPKMKNFSRRVVSTEMLREVEIDRELIELHSKVDLNKAIQHFHEKECSRGLR